MTAAALLRDLVRLGVVLRVEGDRLKVHVPKGVLTPDLVDRLRAHKAEVLDILNNRCPWCRGESIVEGATWWWCFACEAKLAPRELPLVQTADKQGIADDRTNQ